MSSLLHCLQASNNIEEIYISKKVRLNESIRAPQIRVITADGRQLGVMSLHEAITVAREQDLDLVEVSPNANPPVAKIIDWGKFNYQRTKQLQKNKRNTKAADLKQIRLGLKISNHDLDVKLKKVLNFLEASHKVKFTIFYRGRELAHKDIGFTLADKIITMLGDKIIVDQIPQLSGKQITFVVRSNLHAKAKDT